MAGRNALLAGAHQVDDLKPEMQGKVAAFKDGLTKTARYTKWLAIIDIDEFLLPMRSLSIPDCLDKYFAKADAIYVNWRNFGSGGVFLTEGESILENLTKCSERIHPENSIGKSIVRPDRVLVEKINYPHHFPLQDKAIYLNGDRQTVFFDKINKKLQLDGLHHDLYLRINHYKMRDENFFFNVRLANPYLKAEERTKLIEHYEAFSKDEDFTIIQLINKLFDLAN